MLNRLRDKSRDKLAHDLSALGIKAEIGARGREQEKIRSGSKWLFQASLGVIDIGEGPVK
jgi:hypothetical protein